MCVVVPLHHQLVSPADHLEVVGVSELIGSVVAPRIASPPRRRPKALSPLFRVRPEKITHHPVMWHILNTIEVADLINPVDIG